MSRPSKNYSSREKKEGRNFSCILYPDSSEYDAELLLNRLSSFWDRFYYILHDKDVYLVEDVDKWTVDHPHECCPFKEGDPKKPHYHVIGHVDAPCILGRAATKFGIESNYVQKIDNLSNAVQYLLHMNHGYKYQYDRECLITNDDNIEKLLSKRKSMTEKANIIVDFIGSGSCHNIMELSQFAIKNECWDELRRGQHIYLALLQEYNSLLRLKYERKS